MIKNQEYLARKEGDCFVTCRVFHVNEERRESDFELFRSFESLRDAAVDKQRLDETPTYARFLKSECAKVASSLITRKNDGI